MTDNDVLGPVDYLVVEFPADKANFSGEIAAELASLVDHIADEDVFVTIIFKIKDQGTPAPVRCGYT